MDGSTAFTLLDRFVAQRMRADHAPGLSVALTDREQLLHVATYGYADVDARVPVTPGTLFEIGSIGKSFTSIALLQEVERGRLDLHAPVTRYLPWFTVPSAYDPITLHHLLSHTAGITGGSDFAPDARAEVWALRNTAASVPPGQYFHYSNVGYKALGLVLQRLLGQPYADSIVERILRPLGMIVTAPVITHETRPRLAVGYQPFYDDRPMPPHHPLAPAPWLETDTADGCLAATPSDMAAYLRMLLNRGQSPQGRILSEAAFALLIGRVIPAWATRFYGYGLATWESDGHACLGHGGSMPGFVSSLLGDLDAGLGVVVLANGPGNPHEIAEVALRLLRAAQSGADLPSLPPIPARTRVANAAAYAGTYTAGATTFTLLAEEERLILQQDGAHIVLEERAPERFYVDHPAYARFLLSFGRDGDTVVEAFHGPDWYTNERYAGPAAVDHPPEWAAYPGHYRAHTPWLSNLRVALRKGMLVLIYPSGTEEALAPVDEGIFRVGEDGQTPERIRFSTILEGQALQATLAMCDYYRFFTP